MRKLKKNKGAARKGGSSAAGAKHKGYLAAKEAAYAGAHTEAQFKAHLRKHDLWTSKTAAGKAFRAGANEVIGAGSHADWDVPSNDAYLRFNRGARGARRRVRRNKGAIKSAVRVARSWAESGSSLVRAYTKGGKQGSVVIEPAPGGWVVWNARDGRKVYIVDARGSESHKPVVLSKAVARKAADCVLKKPQTLMNGKHRRRSVVARRRRNSGSRRPRDRRGRFV